MKPPSHAPPRPPKPRRTRSQELVDAMIDTARTLERDGVGVGDLKIVARSLQEMRDAFALFAPYRGARKVATFGSARTKRNDPIFRVAEDFSRAIADAGFMVITGAGGGIMEACQRGAGRERSFGVNIALPFEQYANPVIHGDTKLMSFRYFFTRKLFFIKEASAVVLFPGGFGTHDEGFEVLTLLQTGKCQPMPLVLLDRPGGTYWKTLHRYVHDHMLRRHMVAPEDLALYKVTDRVDEAVHEITTYYRVYHSARYVKDLLVLRLNYALPPERVAELAAQFADITADGRIQPCAPFPQERDDTPPTLHLPRLALRFDRKSFGRLRALIDRINAMPG